MGYSNQLWGIRVSYGRNLIFTVCLTFARADFSTPCAGYLSGPLCSHSEPRRKTCWLQTSCSQTLCLDLANGRHQMEMGVGSTVRSGFSCPGFLSVTLLDAGCVPQPEASHPSSCQPASLHSSFLQVRNRFLAQLPLLALRPHLLRAPRSAASHWSRHPHLYETLLKLHRVRAPSFLLGFWNNTHVHFSKTLEDWF